MKINVKLYGLQQMESLIGGNEISVQIEGNTAADLLHHLTKTYGEQVRNSFPFQLLRNGREWIRWDDLSHSLEDGDQLSLLLMAGGGSPGSHQLS